MRLDLFLKASRLCARRTIAQKFCDAGRVSLNGHKAKSSHEVKVGDEMTLQRQQTIATIRVLAVPATRQTSRKKATTLYEIVREESLPETSAWLPEATR
jgi:ribosomal 50S subunit-recycling heat shock protein